MRFDIMQALTACRSIWIYVLRRCFNKTVHRLLGTLYAW